MRDDITENKIVFLVWNRQSIRAYGISKHIGASLHYLYTPPIKHPMLFIKTLQVLIKERPKIIICQSPPITCAFIAMLYKYLFNYRSKPKILIDAHTGAINSPLSRNVSRLIMKSASAVIVINKELQNYVIQNYRITPIVLEDPIPDFTEILLPTNKQERFKMEQNATFNVGVISSFEFDEPLQAVVDAALKLPDVYFYITGDKKNADKKLLINKPANVIMTGFLDYNAYIDLLYKVDVIMDLTTDSMSVPAGAFEVVGLEKPLITSDWVPLRRHFNKGTIYIKNSTDDIKEGIVVAITNREKLSKDMHQLKIEKANEWKEKISKLYYLFQ